MAKKAPIQRDNISFSFKKVDEVASQINEGAKPKKKSITIRIHPDNLEEWENLYKKFLVGTGNIQYLKKHLFFKLIIQEMILKLQQENNFFQIKDDPKYSELVVGKIGRRNENTASVRQKDATFIGYTYYDDTIEQFKNMSFSLAKKENYANMGGYSRNYFFYKMIEFTKENLKELIKKYK